ncbi:MAG: DUF7916 family protein [Catonella sp.]|uniref:DUF7916 family protein n=1 Tax=Catonella sp. TaxID=2382125 RepID=UPI003FA14D80
MKKRLLNCVASDIRKMSSEELKNAIIASEGRTILGETVVTAAPLFEDVTNAEVMSAFGADLILLNEYDVFTKYINGMNVDNPISYIKELTGKPIGINLEPVDETAEGMEELITLPLGRRATKETFEEAWKQGIDFILLTGNPDTGVSNNSIMNSIEVAKKYFKGLVFAGKMHTAGFSEKILSEDAIMGFMDKGADGILIPAVGTAPGIGEAESSVIVDKVKMRGGITISAVGTSQESADTDTIRQIGLCNKRVGFDIHHLGDGGYGRVPDPENLMALSICIRGKRHTYMKMSRSIKR